VENI
jgi:hypothetical protein